METVAIADRPSTVRLVLFVATAFGISWTLWFIHPLFAGEPSVALSLDQLATFGPAAAALFVANDPSARAGRPSRVVTTTAALAALALSSLILTPRAADASTPLAATLLVALAIVPAAIVWAAGSRNPRVGNLLGSILSPRSPWWTYLVALLLFPAASVVGGGLVLILGGELGSQPQALTEAAWINLLTVFAATLLFGGPLGEEVGWRGWLLPTLQARISPLLASLIVGLIWGLWHIPLHLRGMYDSDMGTGLAGLGLRLASSCLLAVLFTWLYNRARGGLLVVILLHTSVNNTSGYWLPVNAGLTVVLLVIALVVVIADGMYTSPKSSHRRAAEGAGS